MYLYSSLIHWAPTGFIVLKGNLIGAFALLMNTCSAYHSSNFLLRKSLAGLLTLRSKGCKWSVQLAGTKTVSMKLSLSSCRTSLVNWALKLSKMHSALDLVATSLLSSACE